jgi:hypothetical protein
LVGEGNTFPIHSQPPALSPGRQSKPEIPLSHLQIALLGFGNVGRALAHLLLVQAGELQ